MTTTNPFTEAARAEAERRCTIARSTRVGSRIWSTRHMHDFGVAMAEWARDHLAAQEPTEAELEDAVASMKRQAPGDTPDWPEWVWARFARVALSARAARRDEEKRDG